MVRENPVLREGIHREQAENADFLNSDDISSHSSVGYKILNPTPAHSVLGHIYMHAYICTYIHVYHTHSFIILCALGKERGTDKINI